MKKEYRLKLIDGFIFRSVIFNLLFLLGTVLEQNTKCHILLLFVNIQKHKTLRHYLYFYYWWIDIFKVCLKHLLKIYFKNKILIFSDWKLSLNTLIANINPDCSFLTRILYIEYICFNKKIWLIINFSKANNNSK